MFINHDKDSERGEDSYCTREGNVSSHCRTGCVLSADIKKFSVSVLSSLDSEIGSYDVIGIDEIQFYPDLAETVRRWVNEKRKVVICAGLNGDIRMKPFGQVSELICMADKVELCHARCEYCLRMNRHMHLPTVQNACFTVSIQELTQNDEEVVAIGGADKYMPVCRYHYSQHQSPEFLRKQLLGSRDTGTIDYSAGSSGSSDEESRGGI